MAEVVDETGPLPVRERSTGSTSVSCPMLTSTNYTVWSMRMKVVLKIHKAWEIIEPGTAKNQEKDDLAVGLIYQSIPESLIIQIGEQETSKGLWEAIKARHVGADRVKEARLQTLSTEFDRLKMAESESIDNFAGKLSGISSKSAALGETIEETKMVKKFLKSLPQKFIQIVASLEQVLDLKTVGFEDVVGRLKAYEERIKGEEYEDGENRVMWSSSSGDGRGKSSRSGEPEQQSGKRGGGGRAYESHGQERMSGYKSSRGFNQGDGSGSKLNGGSVNGSGGSKSYNRNCCCEKNRKNRDIDRSKITCYRCDKLGHFASECPDRLQKLQDGDFSGGEDNDELVF